MGSPIKVCCFYSRKDEPLLQDIKNHLAPLRKQGLIDIWTDADITPGTNWNEEIEQQLKTSQIILLLISPDSMASNFFYHEEMMKALERHDQGLACVIPIILRSVYWQEAPFSKLQALPKDAKPVRNWPNKDQAFLSVVEGIRSAIKNLPIQQKSIIDATSLSTEPQANSQINPSQPLTNSQPLFNHTQTLKDYLSWVIAVNSNLTLPGIGNKSEVPLVEVYVALRGDKTGDYEHEQARELLDTETLEKLHKMREEISEEEFIESRLTILQNKPLPRSLMLRDRPGQQSTQFAEVVSLAQAFQTERRLIILGDPGSGKTTLVRWLALKLASALENWEYGKPVPRVRVPISQVDPDIFTSDEIIDLGPARLPILIRVADYAEKRASARAAKTEIPTFINYLGSQPWLGEMPKRNSDNPVFDFIPEEDLRNLFLDAIKLGQAVVILDGLDELTENRADVVGEIQNFVKAIKGQGEPVLSGGNQVVITSRIAGYHLSPILCENLTHVTIEPMRRPAVEHFCHAMTSAVHDQKDQDHEAGVVQAQGLIDAIYDEQNWRIRELASNPLLITILFLVYRNEKGLPQQRAVLYNTAMTTLIKRVWQTTNLVARIGIDDLIKVLARLAAYIHQKHPTGLIREHELREKLTEFIKPIAQRTFTKDDINTFILVVNKDVGLLAARGDKLYGFLHLTFQEYLAAIHLVQDKEQAHNEILQRLDSPRWREPILLALGYIGTSGNWGPEARERLLLNLLNAADPLKRFLPRIVLLVSKTIPEMGEIAYTVIYDVVERLLTVYSDQRLLTDYSVIRDQIEDALATLRLSDQRNVDIALIKLMRENSALVPVVAQLVYKRGWLTRTIVETLQKYVEYDSPEWDWIVNRVLQDLVTPLPNKPVRGEPPPPEAPNVLYHKMRNLQEELRKLDDGETLQELETEIEAVRGEIATRGEATSFSPESENDTFPLYQRLEGLQQQLNDVKNEYTKTELVKNITTAENEYKTYQVKYKRFSTDYAVAYAVYTEEKKQQQQAIRAPLAPDYLKFRAALKRNPKLVKRIQSNPAWLRLVTALYGGFGDYQAAFWSKEYDELASFLALSEGTRDYLISQKREYYVGKWGYNDTVHSIVVYLDEKQDGNSSRARQVPEFQVDSIYRDTLLNQPLLDGLFQNTSTEALIAVFWSIWYDNSALPEKRIEALVALALLGQDVIQALNQSFEHESSAVLAQKVLLRMAQIASSLDDAVVRSQDEILKQIPEIHLPTEHWLDFMQTAVRTLIVATKQPIDIKKLARKAPPEARPLLEADKWFFTAVSIVLDTTRGLDRVYSFARILETIKNNDAADFYICALLSAWRAPNVAAAPLIHLSHTWQLDPLAPESTDPNDISLDALDGLEAFHVANDVHPHFGPAFRMYIFMNFREHIQRNPDLLPEMLLLCLPYLSEEPDFITSFDAGLAHTSQPMQYIYTKISQMLHPYYRARALLRLLPYVFLHADFERLVTEIKAACDIIEDVHQKVVILERFIQYAPQSQLEIFQELWKHARLIPHVENRARALARIARLSSADLQPVILAEALQTTTKILNEHMKAELLSLIGLQASNYPDGIKLLRNLAATLSTDWLKAKALGLLATHFLHNTAEWEGTEHSQALWTPLLVSASFREICDYFIKVRSLESLWLQFAESTSYESLFALLDQGAETGLVLTHTAVRALDSVITRGKVQLLNKLLPLLHSPAANDIGTIETWLRCPYTLIADHAALFITEAGRQFTPRYIPHLLALLNGNIDRSRDRVHIMITNGMHNVGERDRTLYVSTLGHEALEMLVSDSLKRDEEGQIKSSSASWIVIDVIHDSPEQLQSWIAACNQDSDEDSVTAYILRNIEALTDETLHVFIDALTGNSLPVQIALLESLCRLSVTQKGDVKLLGRLILVLRDLPEDVLDTISVLPNRYMAVTEAARTALQEYGEPYKDQPEIIELAESVLSNYAMTLSQIIDFPDKTLREYLEVIGNTFYVPHDGIDPFIIEAADAIGQNHELFNVLTLWLQKSLQELVDAEGDGPYHAYNALLCVVAEVAKRMPATFANLANPDVFEPLLIYAACHSAHWYGRRAAVELLGLLRFVTGRITKILDYALKDHYRVKRSVLLFVENLQNMHDDTTTELIEELCQEKMLYHESAAFAYAVASILSLLGRNAYIDQEQRRTIQTALATATDDPRSRRGVYGQVGNASLDDRLKTVLLCKLNEGIFRAALETSGVL